MPQPFFSPAEVTKCVLELADRDNDGECTSSELSVVPGLALKEAMMDMDSDKNGMLSGQEISAWLNALRGTKVALAPAAVCILQGGVPVPGVRVRIVPERCMGNGPQVAEGTTDQTGMASLRISSPPLGAHFGIYRVHLTGKDRSGNPIPSKYDTESSLGLVVPLFGRPPTFELE